jgi:hypothetical protein
MPLTIGAVRNRRQHLGDVKTFLDVLVEIASGATAGAMAACEPACAERASLLSTASKLASLVADAASPFAVDGDSATAVTALNTVTNALRVFSAVDAAPKPDDDSPAIRDPLPPFLPQVHVLWPVYIGAVASGHAAAARRSLELIPEVAMLCGGDFLRDRVRSDLWPHLKRMLAPDGTSARMRHSALECLDRLANHEASREALYHVALVAAEALVALLSTCTLDAAAEQTVNRALAGLAVLDADAIFLLQWLLGRVTIPQPPCGRYATSLLPTDRLFAAV